ncbi:MAG TPA: maleylpyruvate isomerase family mycothiol-dependent enzyme [Polyangiaceae bacterium]|nr:maleylpyruvate isomerase family mycothiol-dependent enzyme [Polyangiaceae bacterium]
MTVVLSNAELGNGLLASYGSFADALDGFDDTSWRTATRCGGWEVRDVAGHVVGLANDAATGVPGSRTPDEQAAALRELPASELAAQLRGTISSLQSLMDVLDDAAWDGPSGVPDTTLAKGVHGLWWDTYAHDDDIRAALGIVPDRGPNLTASIAYLAYQLTSRGWGPATLTLDGLPPIAVGAGGRAITGDPHEFMLVAAGRSDASTLGLDPTVNVYLA